MYQIDFETVAGAWATVRLPFSDLVPTYRGRVLTDVPPIERGRIASVGLLVADRQEGPFRIEIDWIRAYRRDQSPAEPPTAE
jgi:monofunctional biosynthetic peptidoglycan transglycosylase